MKYFAYSLILFLFLGIFSFTVVSAETTDINKNSSSIIIDSESSFLIANTHDESEGEGNDESEGEGNDERNSGDVALTNPLGDENTTVMDILSTIIDGLRDTIAPPIVAIVLLYGGFLMLFSGGNPEKFNQGKKAIGYAVAGYVIILIASGITLLIESILGG